MARIAEQLERYGLARRGSSGRVLGQPAGKGVILQRNTSYHNGFDETVHSGLTCDVTVLSEVHGAPVVPAVGPWTLRRIQIANGPPALEVRALLIAGEARTRWRVRTGTLCTRWSLDSIPGKVSLVVSEDDLEPGALAAQPEQPRVGTARELVEIITDEQFEASAKITPTNSFHIIQRGQTSNFPTAQRFRWAWACEAPRLFVVPAPGCGSLGVVEELAAELAAALLLGDALPEWA